MNKRSKPVVIVGGGGREHALAWKLRQSPEVSEVICLPGNPGMADVASCQPADANNVSDLVRRIREIRPGLVVVGPEKPLTLGLADLLGDADVPTFGPRRIPAQLEGSKAFAKKVMAAANVPTARSFVARRYDDAADYIRKAAGRLVVKADGLCAGKGVDVCDTADEALGAADAMLRRGKHGEAGARIIIEDRLVGREVSVMAICDGERAVLLPTAQDYKRREEDDRGEMTGGMGTYSPAPGMDDELLARIQRTVFEPTLRHMAQSGCPFRGLLYAGLMLTDAGPMVLEYNVRFGDPETQVVLPRIDGDLFGWLYLAATGSLPKVAMRVRPEAAVCVVQAAAGYPKMNSSGKPITGLDQAAALPGVHVFHAGTKRLEDGTIVTNGGRVLGTTALGETLAQARSRAYEAVSCITWSDEAHRTDIAADA